MTKIYQQSKAGVELIEKKSVDVQCIILIMEKIQALS